MPLHLIPHPHLILALFPGPLHGRPTGLCLQFLSLLLSIHSPSCLPSYLGANHSPCCKPAVALWCLRSKAWSPIRAWEAFATWPPQTPGGSSNLYSEQHTPYILVELAKYTKHFSIILPLFMLRLCLASWHRLCHKLWLLVALPRCYPFSHFSWSN